MENQEQQVDQEMVDKWERIHKRGKVVAGLFVVAIGILFLARELGAQFPHWFFSWKMLLIAIGLMLVLKHQGRNIGGFILLFIGSGFIISDNFPSFFAQPLILPLGIIAAGLFIIFKPHRKQVGNRKWARWEEARRHKHMHMHRYHHETNDAISSEDVMSATVVMGAIKKNVVTKTFKGGEVTVIFGGAEINLAQADFENQIELEVTQVFGGAELIVPAHWEIRSELVSVFGGIEDKRNNYPATEPKKIMILRGNVVFGGLEIKSY